MARYIGLIDGEPGAYGICFPDLPGCTAMADTVEEVILAGSDALRDWASATLAARRPLPTARSFDQLREDHVFSDAVEDSLYVVPVPLVLEIGRQVRANLSIDQGILDAIDAEAGRRKITRSALVEALAREALPKMAAG